MDVLKDKNYKKYSEICRYTNVPYYYHTEDDKYIYGIGSNVFKNISYTLHEVKKGETLDSLALKYYNNPTFYWVIGYFNDIQDCFEDLLEWHPTLKIPNIANIKFGDDR